MDFSKAEATFVDIGGRFITSAYDLQKKLTHIKAFVFDWDGVFNAGYKTENTDSGFSEVDSLGVTLLRYGYKLRTGNMAKTAIFSGAASPSASFYARRDHIDEVYIDCSEKQKALDIFCKTRGISPEEVCYCFDDILDIPVAEKAGIRLAVGRTANPLFLKYMEENECADYLSSGRGHEHAVREFCELLLMLMEKYEETLEKRAAFDLSYQEFQRERKAINTFYFKYNEGKISPAKGSE